MKKDKRKRWLCDICTSISGKRVYHGAKKEREIIKELLKHEGEIKHN